MKFKFSSLEKVAIKWALKKEAPWSVNTDRLTRNDPRAIAIGKLKDRIKKYHLIIQNRCCAYCRLDLDDRCIETDREHILPKNKLRNLTFSPYNLTVACKRCNMSVKGGKTKHIASWSKRGKLKSLNILDQYNYNIIHPNIHCWEDFIEIYVEKSNESTIVIYYPKNRRGKFTYDFFQLRNLEILKNKEAQRNVPKNKKGLHPEIAKLNFDSIY